MSDDNVLTFPRGPGPAAATALAVLEAARDAHIEAFRAWLRDGGPGRYDAELELEVFAATARQMIQLYAKAPRT